MGSIINVSAPTETYSSKFKQKDFGPVGKIVLELKVLNPKLQYIPRLVRYPLTSTWQPYFLSMSPKNGIEIGTYSSLRIFHASTEDWEPVLRIHSGSGLLGCGIKKMTFITKSGKSSRLTNRMKNQNDLSMPIDIADPIVKIIVE